MADNFFGFDTDFPSENEVLGRHGLEDEILTDAEEEYDALNDETFGQAANDDWEEAHEKLSELIKNNNVDVKSYFNDSLLENDDSQVEIVSKSISQLGLEDDLDDPAIMTISRNCHPSSRLGPVFGPSPPPPAILETELCGSPKTHSIWSTTPKDSGISFLQSFSRNSSSSLAQQELHTSVTSASDNVFLTPNKTWRAEELERDLLSASSKEQSSNTSINIWPQTPSQINMSSNQNTSNKYTPKFPVSAIQYHNKINRVYTREEVERQMHADPRIGFQSKAGNLQSPLPRMTSPMMHPNMMPPVHPGNNLNTTRQSSPVVPLLLRGAVMRGPMEHPFVPFSSNLHPRNMLNHQMPRSDYMMHNHSGGGGMNPFMGLPRQINPLMPNYKPAGLYDKQHDIEIHRNGTHMVEDEYAGLMTQKEKDWLCRIQLLLLKSENPYVEDYYYTTQLARKFKKKYSENAKKGGGDAPELILPETPKPENKTYVPTQFEGSLGKLQAVSVNFPRKVLDIKVARPLEDDEGRIVTNQSLMKFRRLLLDIEKLYSSFLDIEDEEKRILAKPETGEAFHRNKIAALTLKIFNGLCSENSDDNFQNIMTIRKGRNLIVRVFPLFSQDQQLQCLTCLCRFLSLILKKDQNDLILVKNFEILTNLIQKCSIIDLVCLGEALENGTSSEFPKDKNNVVAAFKNKFGSSVICSMIKRAEELYSGCELLETDILTRWSNIILYFVEIICNLENASLASPLMPCFNLLKHFQRFAVDKEKYEILKEKLSLLETDSKSEVQKIV